MKNLLKFGFLGLALTIGFASCGGQQTQNEDATETVTEGIENSTEQLADSLENVADSVRAEGDSIVDSLENVQ
ncbi:hypothetical protein [Sphingobacterium gobiense]|uniref:YtxH domain-containing protein n=1 Tax=Sphingobacterium gobiense TaxID=1382456 RepID=A0A2S9JMS1_9SPHI|nr:hypothetical protein [Sphingobacterium gobiense]PRD54457.1 hypothetical protein C5749_13450 [Sphingobacterium gobiense]